MDEVARLVVKITADGSQAIGVLSGIEQTVGTLADSNATTMNKIAASGALATKIGTTLTKTVGVATVAGLTASAKAAGQLNKELANIGTLSVPTDKLKQYKGQIQDIAIATGKSTSDIAEGTYQVVSAFGDSADTMEKVEINAKAARAGLATTADSIALTSAVTKAYGDTSAAATQKAADLAFKTVELGQTTFPELAQSIGAVTSLSKELGVSQEELFATYATLTGVTGNASEVQTQLKGVLNGLIKPSEKMAKTINSLGYESGYAMVNSLGFAGTLEALQETTGHSSEGILELFNNNRAISGILPLVGELYDKYTEKLGKMNEASGASAKAFEVQTEGIAKTGFTLEQAKVKMQVAAQKFGESAAPIIGDFAGVVDRAADALANMSDKQRETIINAGVWTTAIVAGLAVAGKAVTIGTKVFGAAKSVGSALAKIGSTAGEAASETAVISEVGAHAASSISGIATAFGAVTAGAAAAAAPATIAAGIMIAGGAAVEAYYDKLETSGAKATEEAENYAKVSREAFDMNETAKSVEEYTSRYNELKNIISTNNATDAEIAELKAAEQWFIDNYGQFITAEEQKNGIRQTTIDLINQMAQAEAKRAEQERRNARFELYENQKRYKDNATAAVGELPVVQSTLDRYKSQIDEASRLQNGLEVLKNKYEAINNAEGMSFAERSEAIHKLTTDNQELLDSYERLTGGKLYLPELESEIQNLASLSEEWSDKLPDLENRLSSLKRSVKEYGDALAILGGAATGEVLDDMGFGSIMDLFQNGGEEQVDTAIEKLSKKLTLLGFSSAESAAQVAYFKNGFNDLNSAIQSGALGEVVNDFINRGREVGLKTSEIVSQAALLKNGFQSINEALASGDLGGTINDLGHLGSEMGMMVDQIDAIAHSLGLIPEDKHIEITAEGNFEAVDGMTQRLKELETENVHVSVNADGDITILSTATGETKELKDTGAVWVAVNADGNIDVLDQAGNKIKEIKNDPSANVTVETDADPSEAQDKIDALDDEPVKVKVDADVDEANAKIKGLEQTITITANLKMSDVPSIMRKATGTQNFAGGLAMVNDQRGVADPRELIVDKGRAFIPDGRDVVLPLSKGAKVYTAAQTKRIMAGIPRFADGKDNSDAFISARDDWTHYTRTHAVTTTEELRKWVELSKQFTDNQKDVWDIEEQIYTLQRKINDELNKASLAYIDDRAALGDWDEYGDSAIDAFNRIQDRNKEALDAGRLTYDEYIDNISAAGKSLFDGRRAASEKWLAHEEKYNGLSAADYLAGIDRMREYTTEYYMNGIISHREYIEAVAGMDELYLDKRKEQIQEMYDISKGYISDRTYFNDWDGDDPIAAYRRVQNDRLNELRAGELTQTEYDEYMSSLGSDMLKERIDQSKRWLDEQRKYFGMSDKEYAEGIERMKAYTDEYYAEGLIGRREYNEAMTELNHMAWDEAESSYEEMLMRQSKYISDMRDKFSKEEQALRDGWDIADRAADIAEVGGQMRVYSAAVTSRGQQKYKELQEQMKKLRRDEELYKLQKRNNSAIEKLEADYEKMEADKKTHLAQIATVNRGISSIVDRFKKSVSTSTRNVESILGDILSTLGAVEKKKTAMGPTYSDNRNVSISLTAAAEMLHEFIPAGGLK